MRIRALFALTASLLGSFGSCDTKFISPPDWRDDKRNRGDPEKNKRYVVGETIPVQWETDNDRSYLLLFQVVPEPLPGWRLAISTGWKASYDMSNQLENGEDSQYNFEIWDRDSRKQLASSLYFNVTAPKDDIRTFIFTAPPPSTVTVVQSQPIEAKTTSTTIESTQQETKSAGDEEENISTPEMSPKEVAGAAVGGVVGGLLIFGAIGWLLWRGMAKRKSQPVDSATVQYQEQVVETKAELPGDNSVHPSEYAKSPTGIYEAP
ncbi:uncharacterized protein B0J16DRAFT_381967 [Fusarium flagelliforme]|uniref:Uncharacterized protein n=1 Tax=Fusarium flagelliforme TaxID=2675880 RepID=A0A395N314_9HYPO|nr:uncharacterized protein B0J16DRAFT_381967 [Fusarium flagelliforme]KAH7188082.1 hypothetical protein B0J16DRAFT_381967 [Fusarium flagelliforme]RFN54522.1 hypothetical protein FIE12Z_1177 [Fusarium flagelliforme]